jgi:hypothetical protein
MSMSAAILEIIRTSPGTSKESLRRQFDLSPYRLNRVLRGIQRELSGTVLAHNEEHGVWIVAFDTARCAGMEWMGAGTGYAQCTLDPEFTDGCCWGHSGCTSLEMTAFERRLCHLAGPADPSAYTIGQLSLLVVEELCESLARISPVTRGEEEKKRTLHGIMQAALAFVKRKEAMRQSRRENWIPPELRDRHRRSSGNLFEFSLKKHFVVLEVLPSATREEVIKAWRKLSRRFHPDAAGGDEERMKLVNIAKDRIFRIKGWD